MSTEFSDLRYGSNKILVITKIVISLILFIGAIVVQRTYGTDMTADTARFWRWISVIPMLSLFISLSSLGGRYIKLSSNGVTYVYTDVFKQEVNEIFEWHEIDSFEKLDSFVFFKKIKIVTKDICDDRGRNCKIWIRDSQIPRDELCNILNEKLEIFNKSNIIN